MVTICPLVAFRMNTFIYFTNHPLHTPETSFLALDGNNYGTDGDVVLSYDSSVSQRMCVPGQVKQFLERGFFVFFLILFCVVVVLHRPVHSNLHPLVTGTKTGGKHDIQAEEQKRNENNVHISRHGTLMLMRLIVVSGAYE